MSAIFSAAERDYLERARLARLATTDGTGRSRVVPVEWRYNDVLDVIDVTGRDFAGTPEFESVRHDPEVVVVIDDLPESHPQRAVVVRGTAEALDHLPTQYVASGALIRVRPQAVVSWGLGPVADDGSTKWPRVGGGAM